VRLVEVAALLALGACNIPFGVDTVGPPIDGSVLDVQGPSADLIVIGIGDGCADGTRDGFLDAQRYPAIAACQGKWNKVGLSTARTGHACDSVADLQACAAADLCAAGWEICADQAAVGARASACDANATPGFYVTLQRSQAAAVCDGVPGGANDLFGCQAPSATEPGDSMTCPPLNATSGDGCREITGLGFVCSSGSNELNTVQKTTFDSGGGVLCCKM
jgi:hypothetical protein